MVLGQFEEIVFLRFIRARPKVGRAIVVLVEVFLILVLFAIGTVVTLVVRLVDVALLPHTLQDLPDQHLGG